VRIVFSSRDYGRPDEALLQAMQGLPVAVDDWAHAGSAELNSGERLECVYFAEAAPYIQTWGVWPEDDRGKRFVDWRQVRTVMPSRQALPKALWAGGGEYAMGAMAFELEFSDGAKYSCATGNAIDFLTLPDGRLASEVVGLKHITRSDVAAGRVAAPRFCGADYHWCLFGEYPSPSANE
jgi:hypothetical protein